LIKFPCSTARKAYAPWKRAPRLSITAPARSVGELWTKLSWSHYSDFCDDMELRSKQTFHSSCFSTFA